jgi:type VI secretion system protein ImpA
MNLEALLAPVSNDAPCGEDLSFSSDFDLIRELRREDDPTLDQGEWVTELKVADWPRVVEMSRALLSTRTKDLRVAGWLADGAARSSGFSGLADGLDLCSELIARYWDGLYPRAENGDQELRIGSLNWLLSRVDELAGMTPLAAQSGARVSLRDIDTARARQQAVARGAQESGAAGADAAPTLESIRRVVTSAGRPALEAMLSQARRAQAALARLQSEVDARLGIEGPAFGGARKALENVIDAAERLGRDCGFAGVAAAVSTPVAVSRAAVAAAPVTVVDGATALSRAQALQQLREVADFFRRTEPHSPVAYLADKAAKWGDMPLHLWLRSVVKDGGSLAQLEDLLGIDPLPGDAGSRPDEPA